MTVSVYVFGSVLRDPDTGKWRGICFVGTYFDYADFDTENEAIEFVKRRIDSILQ